MFVSLGVFNLICSITHYWCEDGAQCKVLGSCHYAVVSGIVSIFLLFGLILYLISFVFEEMLKWIEYPLTEEELDAYLDGSLISIATDSSINKKAKKSRVVSNLESTSSPIQQNKTIRRRHSVEKHKKFEGRKINEGGDFEPKVDDHSD
ncbi:hypothetical protein M3Y98_00874100 [Aphelenchoides besseyi]|nr:hypothetical protein M3Y98_00874100 [Aphelenchoides besseyi]KAI6211313.1 hypothetical protein M3Y96_00420400 [Aphelenchoides besseyi]